MIRRVVVVPLMALAMALTAFALAAPAEAARNATPGCMSVPEFRAIKKGTTLKRANEIAGVKGRITSQSSFSDGDEWWSVKFRPCRPNSSVYFDFEKTERRVWVADWYCYDWDGDGYEEDCEDYGYYDTRYSLPMRMTSKSAYWG